ncbi:MAG: diguanylate cyclase [Planctomycetes bacterium]|nr:diguanylate cyclase [Planctomycetota bacterium]
MSASTIAETTKPEHPPSAGPTEVAPWEVALLEGLERYLEPRDRLRALGEELPRILGTRLFSVFVLDRDETRFVPLLHNHRRLPPDLVLPFSAGTLMGDVVLDGRPVRVESFAASPYAGAGDWKTKYQDDGSLALPLVAEGRIVGVLNLNEPREGFTPEWRTRAERFGAHLSRLLDLARRLNAIDEWFVLDAATGLQPRSFFLESLRAELARARRLRVPVSCLLVELVGFEGMAALHGAAAADAAFHHLAFLVREQCRRADVVARYEGACMAALLPGAPRASAEEVAARIRRKVELAPVVPGRGARRIRLQARVGLEESPGDADTPLRLLRRLETALAAARPTSLLPPTA